MSMKNKKDCSNFEHHEGLPPNLGDNPEKIPQENGDIVLTNVVCLSFNIKNPFIVSCMITLLFIRLF